METLADTTSSRAPAPREFPGYQGWGLAALLLGIGEVVFCALTHIVAWLYAALASTNMSDEDTRLGLALSIVYTVVVLTLAILGVVAGSVGMREARRVGLGRGVAFVGLMVSCAGLLFWILASTNLLIVAIARLR